jgi:hypothetical protein
MVPMSVNGTSWSTSVTAFETAEIRLEGFDRVRTTNVIGKELKVSFMAGLSCPNGKYSSAGGLL